MKRLLLALALMLPALAFMAPRYNMQSFDDTLIPKYFAGEIEYNDLLDSQKNKVLRIQSMGTYVPANYTKGMSIKSKELRE